MKSYLIISTSADLVRVALDTIVYISSDGNYSTIILSDNTSRVVTLQLGQIEKLIASQLRGGENIYIRIGKSLIINRNYIYYIHISKQQLILSDISSFSHTISASKESLRQLKELTEKEVK